MIVIHISSRPRPRESRDASSVVLLFRRDGGPPFAWPRGVGRLGGSGLVGQEERGGARDLLDRRTARERGSLRRTISTNAREMRRTAAREDEPPSPVRKRPRESSERHDDLARRDVGLDRPSRRDRDADLRLCELVIAP